MLGQIVRVNPNFNFKGWCTDTIPIIHTMIKNRIKLKVIRYHPKINSIILTLYNSSLDVSDNFELHIGIHSYENAFLKIKEEK